MQTSLFQQPAARERCKLRWFQQPEARERCKLCGFRMLLLLLLMLLLLMVPLRLLLAIRLLRILSHITVTRKPSRTPPTSRHWPW